MMYNPLVPELSVSDFAVSLRFYTVVLGFNIAYQRPEDQFAYLSYQGSQIMIEQAHGVWETGPLEHPYGRGVNFEMGVDRIAPLVEALRADGYPLMVEPQERWYRRDDTAIGQRQFLVMDPDGYLLRFAQSLGTRSVPTDEGVGGSRRDHL
jgi:catechol 2,3-dioxygenase-like lactoylglutathione lyase family enzyme